MPWMEVWRSFSLQRPKPEEQGAALGTEMATGLVWVYFMWVGTLLLAYR